MLYRLINTGQRGKCTLQSDIGFCAFTDRLINRLAGTLPQAEGFHDTHALYVFQKADHKICLCGLSFGRQDVYKRQ